MSPKGPISPVTVSRRELLEWLGKGATLALGAPALASLLAACGDDDGAPSPSADAAPDTGGGGADAGSPAPDAAPGDTAAPKLDSGPFPQGYPFKPTEPEGHPIFDGWGERTADLQDLQKTLSSWKLTIDGMVNKPLTLTFAELIGLPRMDLTADFHCVEGWSIYDVPYNGVSMAELLDRVEPESSASHLTFHSVPSTIITYLESLPIEIAREPKTMLAYGIAGATIPLKHGFPARVVIPRLLGYKNAKFVERIELTDKPIDGFWVARGYPYAGEVPDGRLREGKY